MKLLLLRVLLIRCWPLKIVGDASLALLALAFGGDEATPTLPLIAEASEGLFLPRDLHIEDKPASSGLLPFSKPLTILGIICTCGGSGSRGGGKGGGGKAICGYGGGGGDGAGTAVVPTKAAPMGVGVAVVEVA